MRYVANPVTVNAFKITRIDQGRDITLENGDKVTATPEMCSRMQPHVGDYWVIQNDGYVYLNPKDVFERKYRQDEPTALELGAAVRRAGLSR